MEAYERIKKIGRGTYGDVLLIKRKSDGKLLALKKVVVENVSSSSESHTNSASIPESSVTLKSQPQASKRDKKPIKPLDLETSGQKEDSRELTAEKKQKKFVFDNDSEHEDLFEEVSQRVSRHSDQSQEERALNNEIAILKSLDHPNIIKYYESFTYRKRHICIITEYA